MKNVNIATKQKINIENCVCVGSQKSINVLTCDFSFYKTVNSCQSDLHANYNWQQRIKFE